MVKPIAPLSLYGSYSVSYLPSSGDQFSSLTTITQQVKPEKFNNYEVGVKWDVVPAVSRDDGALSPGPDQHAVDRSERPDAHRPDRQPAHQRLRAGVNGSLTPAWNIAGGYAYQDAFVTSATVSAAAGAQVGQVPHHTLSLWNNYQLHPKAVGRTRRCSTAPTCSPRSTTP